MIPVLTDPLSILHILVFGVLVGASVGTGVILVFKLFKRWM